MSSSILGDIEVAESNVDSSSSTATIINGSSYFKPVSNYRVLQLPLWLRRVMPKWNGIERRRLMSTIAGIAILLFFAGGLLFMILTPKPRTEVVEKVESLQSSLYQSLSDLAHQMNSSSQAQSKAFVEGMKRVVSGLKSVDGGLTALGSGLVQSYRQFNTSLTRLSDSMTHLIVEENTKLVEKLDKHYNLTASAEKKQLISDLSHTLWPTTPSASDRSEVVEEVLEELEEGIALEDKLINSSTPVGQTVYIRWFALSRCAELVAGHPAQTQDGRMIKYLERKLKANPCMKGKKNQMWTFGEGGVLKREDDYCLEEAPYGTLEGKPCHGQVTGYQQWRYNHQKQQLTHPRYYAPAVKHGDPEDVTHWGCLTLDRHDLRSVDLVSCDEESLSQRWLLVDSQEGTIEIGQ